MAKRPSFQFYTGDWMKDPALSMCSPATRGIWIDLLCAIHELDRFGQITGSAEQLSRVCRCSAVQFIEAIQELKTSRTADVTERNGIVTVISRRIKRDDFEREKTKHRVSKHRETESCNADVTDLKRQCNGPVTEMYALSSSSSSSSLKKREKEKKENPPNPQGGLSLSFWDSDVLGIIETVVQIRCAKDKSLPEGQVRGQLKKAYTLNPEKELLGWKREIESNSKSEKTVAQKLKIVSDFEEEDRKVAEQKKRDYETEKKLLETYKKLPKTQRQEYEIKAMGIESSAYSLGLPEDVLRSIIESRIAKLMAQDGYEIELEEVEA